jgi:hypothetical protein
VLSRIDRLRGELRALPPTAWPAHLAEYSGLPGPRANLELARAAAEEASPALVHRLAASRDEYLALCGAVGLGRLLAEGAPDAAARLRRLAEDDRWRVREGIAMALQRLGDDDVRRLLALAGAWAAEPSVLVQRAAVAGVCEPRLLRQPAVARQALDLLDTVTGALAARPDGERRDPAVRVLRQALGYCWSVAVAALPAEGFEALARWAGDDDRDVRRVVRENLGKARLRRADPAAVTRLRELIG